MDKKKLKEGEICRVMDTESDAERREKKNMQKERVIDREIKRNRDARRRAMREGRNREEDHSSKPMISLFPSYLFFASVSHCLFTFFFDLYLAGLVC